MLQKLTISRRRKFNLFLPAHMIELLSTSLIFPPLWCSNFRFFFNFWTKTSFCLFVCFYCLLGYSGVAKNFSLSFFKSVLPYSPPLVLYWILAATTRQTENVETLFSWFYSENSAVESNCSRSVKIVVSTFSPWSTCVVLFVLWTFQTYPELKSPHMEYLITWSLHSWPLLNIRIQVLCPQRGFSEHPFEIVICSCPHCCCTISLPYLLFFF